MHHRVRIVEPGRCSQCGGRMVRFTNGQGWGWVVCLNCGDQIPTKSGYREENHGANESQGDSREPETEA